jgi:DNA (cytosine-5)-methyltransferase 1
MADGSSQSEITYGSVCSGIEAATVAWAPLGWKAAWFAEIEPFPSAVLAHHYPAVPNLGDMTTIAKRVLLGEVVAPDVLVGGTPCQAFSVAGMRQSLDDARGNLTLRFMELANAIDFVRRRAGRPPRPHCLGERPGRPQHERQRIRVLSGWPCRRRCRACPAREAMVERWLCVWTRASNRMADPGRPIFRTGPTPPPCVRCRKC